MQNEVYFADPPIAFPSAKKASHDMAITCFVYLSFQEFESAKFREVIATYAQEYHPRSTKLALDEYKSQYPLLEFASEFWPTFVHGADTYSKSENLWQAFIRMS